MFGFLTINKPAGITSRKAIDAVKRLVHPEKVGHTGTLDPLATGVLVVAVGPATRLTRYVQCMRKTYTAEFQFGVTSDSDDVETELRTVDRAIPIPREELEPAIQKFVGTINQTPPAYSAVKIDGKRAYALAREGRDFEVRPKSVEIHAIEIVSYSYPICKLKIVCGSGTYIRSLGRDLGVSLRSGAVMTSLVRDSVGEFSLESAVELDELDAETIGDNLVAPVNVFEKDKLVLFTPEQILELLVGKLFSASELGLGDPLDSFVAVDAEKRLLAVFEKHRSGNYKPAINFAQYYDRLQS